MIVKPDGTPLRTKVLVLVPTVSHDISASLAGFLSHLQVLNRTQGRYLFGHKIINGRSPVEFARNELSGVFLASDYDVAWFIDADAVPLEQTVNVLEVDADIVSGRMHSFQHRVGSDSARLHTCVFRRDAKGDLHAAMPGEGAEIESMDAAGTGCLVIKRAVLEDPRMRVGHVDGDDVPAIFRTVRAANGRQITGEDVDFTSRAVGLGYSLKVHWGAPCGHIKELNLDQIVEGVLVALTDQKESEPAPVLVQ